MAETKTEIPRWMPTDRRGGHERRSVERRKMAIVVAIDRRRGGDRRSSQRRSGVERRGSPEGGSTRRPDYTRQTLLPYSRDDAERLKAGVLVGDLTCPSCRQPVVHGPRISRGNRSVREYRCMACRKGIMVSVP